MTKSIEKLQGLIDQAREIATKNPTSIALEVKTEFAEDMRKLKASEEYRDLGTGGRMKREEKLREQYRKQLFELLAEQKAEYQKIYDEATMLAKTVQTTPHAKPSDALTVKLFEQELQSLQTSTMLGINGERSIEAINGFIGKYGDDPYFASVIKDNFAQLTQNVLSIEGTPANRQSLAKVFERVEMKANSDEQKVAAETLQAFGDSVPNFYRVGLQPYEALSNIIGRGHANYLDKPTEWLETQVASEQAQ